LGKPLFRLAKRGFPRLVQTKNSGGFTYRSLVFEPPDSKRLGVKRPKLPWQHDRLFELSEIEKRAADFYSIKEEI
jgi:hypothetical protein